MGWVIPVINAERERRERGGTEPPMSDGCGCASCILIVVLVVILVALIALMLLGKI